MACTFTLASGIEQDNHGVESMNLSHFGMLCLAALLTTVIWAVILYFAAQLFGIRIESVLLAQILGGIFVLMLLGLGIAAVTARGGSGGPDDNDPAQGGR